MNLNFKNHLGIVGSLFCLTLYGVTIWSVAAFYGDNMNWLSGNSMIHGIIFTIFGAPVGAIGFIFILKSLKRKRLLIRGLQVGCMLTAIVLSGLCIPYFMITARVGDNAKQQFTAAWGSDWESRIQVPSNGPWIPAPFSFHVQAFGLSYDASEFSVDSDIEFFNNGNDSFKCDVYSPIGEGPYPVLMYIHGGGWCGADKDTYVRYQHEYFAAAGYVVFSVQYGALQEAGMSRQYTMQEIMENLAKFSDWLADASTVQTYHLDLNRTFVTGLSAGGHLSTLVSVACHNVSDWNDDVKLRGGVDFYGITNLSSWERVNQEFYNSTGLFNATVLTDYSIVDPFSPVTYVSSDAIDTRDIVPLLIMHGDIDWVVNVTQGRQMKVLCDARGLKCVYIEVPQGDHGFEMNTHTPGAQLSLWAMERFFQLCLQS